MKQFDRAFWYLILVPALVIGAPPRVKLLDDVIYTANNTCYSAQYDIVDVHLPPLYLTEEKKSSKIFLVEADIAKNEYKGLYVLHNIHFEDTKNGYSNVTARKLLDYGKCITSDKENVYFGTTNGIYTYSANNDTVEKFGTISADIRDIEKDKSKDLIYIVTEENKLYLVTEMGTKMVEHATIRNVQEIAMDVSNRLYFYEKHEDPTKYLQYVEKYTKPKVISGENVLEISGLPDKYTYIKLINGWDDNILVAMNNYIYRIDANGTEKTAGFLEMPSAYSIQIGVIQIYSHDKKVYCYSILEGLVRGIAEAATKGLTMLVQGFVEEVRDFAASIVNS